MAPRIAYRQPQVGGQGFSRTKKVLGGAFALGAADLALAAQTSIIKAPAGFVATDLYAAATDMDTNVSPALALSIGDAGSLTRLLSSSTIGQAGTSTSTIATTGAYYAFTVDTDIIVSATVAAATAAAGTLTVYLEGFMGNP